MIFILQNASKGEKKKKKALMLNQNKGLRELQAQLPEDVLFNMNAANQHPMYKISFPMTECG